MESAIVSLICIGVILSGGLMLTQSAVLSADQLSTDWKAMEVRAGDLDSRHYGAGQVQAIVPWQGVIEVTVENRGQRVLGKFPDWDMVVQYYDANDTLNIHRLDYVSGTTPGNNQWAVYDIELAGSPETFQPGLLDPGEELVLRLKPVPYLGNGETILVVITTNIGVTTSIQSTR